MSTLGLMNIINLSPDSKFNPSLYSQWLQMSVFFPKMSLRKSKTSYFLIWCFPMIFSV